MHAASLCVGVIHKVFAAFLLLQDHYDVKMPCHLLLGKLAAAAPGPVLASLDRLVTPLEKTLTTRLRGEPVKQEVRHLLHCIYTLNTPVHLMVVVV